ncbi:glycoprotein [Souris virus]|uniref:Glycoprotein n=1 Tax=Souris virus TaxID=2010246 RepID=A0A0B6C5N1_9VIRU|nr:glycoprotein [Souris virus]AJI43723.1 glycoprotein [Souris virus]
MGQIITFFQELPHFLEEVMNIVMVVLILLTLTKAIYNLWTCGLVGLVYFLMMAGRSCESGLGNEFQLSSFVLNTTIFNSSMPLSCSKDNSHHYIYMNNTGLEITLTNKKIINHTWCNLSDAHQKDLYDHALMSIVTSFHLNIRGFSDYKAMACDFNGGNITIQYNLTSKFNRSTFEYCHSMPSRILETFRQMFWSQNVTIGATETDTITTLYCPQTDYKYIIIQNVSWENHCEMMHPTPMKFIHLELNSRRTVYLSRRLRGTFTWTLSDNSGTENPGGYCLTRWFIIAADLKCFGNTAIAKCNEAHDEEFCDMLRLFDYNKEAIKRFKGETQAALHHFKEAINALISDQLLMRNHLRDLMGIPYCNYTKFWYLNHTKTNTTTLPKCWLVRNNTYLNETEFSNDIEQEQTKFITEMLKREYDHRQTSMPLGLVDLLLFTTSLFLVSVFLHLARIPTHRHLVGKPCPKPHRLTKMGICSCGLYKQSGVPVVWKRR